MTLLLRPEIQRFIDEQVRAGRFPTPEAVVEAAFRGMLDDTSPELDDPTIAAIKRGREQIERGEGMDSDDVRARWKERLSGTSS